MSELKNVRLPDGLWKLMEEKTGKGNVSAFVVEAILEKLNGASDSAVRSSTDGDQESEGVRKPQKKTLKQVQSRRISDGDETATVTAPIRRRSLIAGGSHVCVPVGAIGRRRCDICGESM